MKSFLIILSSLFTLQILAAELRLEPTFHSCSVYYDGENAVPPRMEYRAENEKSWTVGAAMVRSANNPIWRCSIMMLKEDHAYRVRISDNDGKTLAENTFKTLSPDVNVVREISLPQGPAVISDKGSPDGWLRLRLPAEGLDGGDKADAALLLDGAEYIIIENARISGGGLHAIHARNCRNIRIINCEISGWGRAGKQDFRRRGHYYDKNKKPINYDAGLYIDKSGGVVVERSYFHSPRGTANSWLYAHPAGPCAIFVRATGGTVVRYNDFIGSDRHRWNDVIESNGNGDIDGGFARDADIYGNLMLLGNDDSIELDGGQMNVRTWSNHFEGSLCGVSTAACVVGPSYIWNNLFLRGGDEDGVGGLAIKNNYAFCGQGMIYIYHNTMLTKDGLSPFGPGEKPRRFITTRNNVFDCQRVILPGSQIIEKNDFDYDLMWSDNGESLERLRQLLLENGLEKHGLFAKPRFIAPEKDDYRLLPGSPGKGMASPIPGLGQFSSDPGISGDIPCRPTPLALDRKFIDFTKIKTASVTLSLSGGSARSFRILKNPAFDFFSVSPTEGKVEPGQSITLDVRLLKTDKPIHHKGAFIVKLDDGFSRPVMVYAGTDKQAELVPGKNHCVALIEAENAESGHSFTIVEATGASGGKALELPDGKDFKGSMSAAKYRFSVPADGIYYLAAIFRPANSSSLCSFNFSIDGKKSGKSLMRYSSGWCRAGISDRNDRKNKYWFEPIKLSAGEHTLEISPVSPMLIDAIVVLTDPRGLKH